MKCKRILILYQPVLLATCNWLCIAFRTYAECTPYVSTLCTHELGQQDTKQLRGKTGVTAPHYSGLLCSHPVQTLRELDVLPPFAESKMLTDEIQNHRIWFLKNSVNSILADLDSMTFISKNFAVYDFRTYDCNYINMLSFNLLVS